MTRIKANTQRYPRKPSFRRLASMKWTCVWDGVEIFGKAGMLTSQSHFLGQIDRDINVYGCNKS